MLTRGSRRVVGESWSTAFSVRMLAAIDLIDDLTFTTNGTLLAAKA